MLMWDEVKRKLNIKSHRLEFAGCDLIWDHFTVTRENGGKTMARFAKSALVFWLEKWLYLSTRNVQEGCT